MSKRYIVVKCRTGEPETTEVAVWKAWTERDVLTKRVVADSTRQAGYIFRNDFRRIFEGLSSNGYAYRLSRELTDSPVGRVFSIPAVGWSYRILEADFTSDGTPITPGLGVEDYDRETGIVAPDQFMDDGMAAPGGEYFREPDGSGWYYVLRDGETRPYKKFDGSRLRAL